jgi:HemK-related putative methylase
MVVTSDAVYEPREDSFLLQKIVEECAVGSVLEIGTGSGIQSITAAKSQGVTSVTAVDINPKALTVAKNNAKKVGLEKRITFKKSNLFSAVQGTFDTIIFNPPYLPNDARVKDVALDGGKKGYELTVKFLEEVNIYLTQPGVVLLLFSSYTKKHIIDETIDAMCLTSSLVAEQKLDHEVLYVYKIEKSSLLRELEMQDIHNVKKLARGKRGLVFTGMYKGEKVAIKSKHPKSEALDAIMNEYNVLDYFRNEGLECIPHVVLTGHNYFVYEYIDGELLPDYITKHGKKVILYVLQKILGYMRDLDVLGYTKEEMHRPHKHVLIKDDEIKIIDYERCRKTLKPKNVTQFCQFLTSTEATKKFAKKNIAIDADAMKKATATYKRTFSDSAFKKITEVVR